LKNFHQKTQPAFFFENLYLILFQIQNTIIFSDWLVFGGVSLKPQSLKSVVGFNNTLLYH